MMWPTAQQGVKATGRMYLYSTQEQQSHRENYDQKQCMKSKSDPFPITITSKASGASGVQVLPSKLQNPRIKEDGILSCQVSPF